MRKRKIVPMILMAAILLGTVSPAASEMPEVIVDTEAVEDPDAGSQHTNEKGDGAGGALIEETSGGAPLEPDALSAGTEAETLPDETEAETLTPQTETGLTESETERMSESLAATAEETEAETQAASETLPGPEEETERSEENASSNAILRVNIMTDRSSNVSKCTVRLKNTASADGTLHDIVQRAAHTTEGKSGKQKFLTDVDSLVPGSTYQLTASIYHFRDSAPHTIRMEEDGSILIDGQSTGGAAIAELNLTLDVAVWHSRSSMTQVSLTKLSDIGRPSGNSLQGGSQAADYYLAVFGKSSGNNDIALLNLADMSLIRYAKATAALGHANDLAFVPSRNKMFVLNKLSSSSTRVVQLHGTSLSWERNIELNYNYHGLAYDPGSDCFFALRSAKNGTVCDVYDYGFSRVLRSFEMETNLTRQGVSIYQGRLYYTCWEAGGVTSYQTVYDGSLNRNENVIYVYDLYGNLQKTYLIPSPGASFEVEDIAFVNGCMILQANDYTSGSAKAGFYRVNPIPSSVEISVPVTQNGKAPADGAYTAVLKRDGVKIGQVKNSGGLFSFGTLPVTEPVSCVYTVTQNKGSSPKDYIYDTDPVSIPLTVVYDPFTNQMTVSKGSASRPAVTNTKLNKKQKKNIKNLKASSVNFKKVKPKKGAVKITWQKVKFGKKKIKDYEVQICRNRKFKGASLVTVHSKKTSVRIKNLISGKKYFVRVRACYTIGVKTYHTKYSAVRKVRVS